MIVVLWGVSGCGKSTVGQRLAERLAWPLLDADDYHPAENIEKMRVGTPLDDSDRWPWLATIATELKAVLADRGSAVLACSALKQAYRDVLCVDQEAVQFVQLAGSMALIADRLSKREHEFMNPALLQSQFQTLEPGKGLTLDVGAPIEAICTEIIREFTLQ